MASGLDTDSLVTAMLSTEQSKIDKAYQEKTKLEWQQEAYVDLIKDIKTFNSDYLDILGPSATNMMSSSAYIGNTASSSDSKLTATVGQGAIKGNYTVKVNSLATSGKVQFDLAQNATFARNDVNNTSDVYKFTVDSKEYTFRLSKQSNINEFISAAKNATHTEADGTVSYLKDAATLQYSTLTNKFTVESRSTGTSSNAAFTIPAEPEYKEEAKLSLGSSKDTTASVKAGTYSINITNGASTDSITVSLAADSTPSQFKDAIQSALTTNSITSVTIEQDADGNMRLQTANSGSDQKIELKGSDGKTLGLATGITEALQTQHTADYTSNSTGKNANVDITVPTGEKVSGKEYSSNVFTVDNLSFNISNMTEDPSNTNVAGSTGTLSVTSNATDSVTKIKKFVEAYNKLLDTIGGKIDEKKQYTYAPLTEAQKDSMTDDQVTKWEKKAKQGLLSRDSDLTSMISSLRETLYENVNSLSKIGITMSNDYTSHGKLVITSEGEEKLKNALEQNGDAVQDLFTNKNTGILKKFAKTVDSYTGREGILVQKAGYENTQWTVSNDLSKAISEKETLLKTLQTKYTTKQTAYYKKFTALETAMSKLSSQQSSLSSLFGSSS
jgi:flagellar hook-associated protein 2